jgi:hypothetical protein
MDKHNHTAQIQVVFLDIEKYSRRRTLTQIEVIGAFTHDLGEALKECSKEFVDYAQKNDLNFQNDIITLPTGDGAAIVFSFDGLHQMHLRFAKALLSVMHQRNSANPCDRFAEAGWCNCHSNYNVRIGISEGRGVVYRDLNGGYNVAGEVVNMAARVMSTADRNQVIFTEEAHRQIIDMVDDPILVDRFKEYLNVQIKHGVKIAVYQYIEEAFNPLNSSPPEPLELRRKVMTISEKMKAIGFPFLPEDMSIKNVQKMADLMDRFADTMLQGAEAMRVASPLEPLRKSIEDKTPNTAIDHDA